MKSNISKNNNNILKILFISINIFLITTHANTTTYQHKSMIKILSSSQTTNILTNTIIFQGTVTLKYQDINMHADKIFIQNIKKKNNLPIIKAYGNPVTFYQIQKLGDIIISAQSLIVHYDTINNIINLIGNAYINQAGNSIHSDNITYIIKDKKIKATANQNNQVITTFLIKN